MSDILIFIICVVMAITGVLLAVRLGLLEFVSGKRALFKTWSVWLGSLGAALSALIQAFPDAALQAWNTLPADVKSMLPEHYVGIAAAFLIAMAVLSQFIRQKNLTGAKNGADKRL